MSRNTELCSICPAECNPVRLSPPGTRTLVSSHTPKAFSRAFLRLRFIISAAVSREWAQSWLARLGGSCLPAVLFVRRGQQSLWDCTQLPRNRIPALAEGGRKGHMLGTTEKQISQEGKTSPVGKHTKTSEHRGFVPCNGAALPDSCCLLTLQAFSALSLSLQTVFWHQVVWVTPLGPGYQKWEKLEPPSSRVTLTEFTKSEAGCLRGTACCSFYRTHCQNLAS